ncbi:MAG: hypothetical protein ACYC9X_09095 [Dehalococcoidia bacterium]
MLEIDIHRQLPGFDLQPRFEAADELVVLFGPSGSGKSPVGGSSPSTPASFHD